MARNVGDWVPLPAWGAQENVDDATPLDLLLVAPRDAIGATGEVGTVETVNELVVERVVGYVDIENPEIGEDEVRVIERIRVGLYDDNGLVAFYSDDPQDASQANEPFLWQRVSRMDAGQNNNNVVVHPWWTFLDVKSARRLSRDQALFYSIWTVGASMTRLNVTPFLRSWARLVNRS